MCTEAGIPLEDCSLVTDPTPAAEPAEARAEDAGGGKAATLVQHGRRVCEQENVPLEDCMALPSTYRTGQALAPSYLVPPATLPPIDPALLAVAPAGPAVRNPRSPAPFVPRSAGAVPAGGDPGIRYLRPPTPAANPYAPVAAPVPAPPIEPDIRFLSPPPPAGPDVRFAEDPAPFVERSDALAFERERPERFFREERLLQEDSFRGDAGFRGEERSGRCRRAVRSSGPASNRFITC